MMYFTGFGGHWTLQNFQDVIHRIRDFQLTAETRYSVSLAAS